MKQINVGINGFGRIGRTFFRLAQKHPNINIVAINDLSDTRTLSHLLKYDSIHGILSTKIGFDNEHIIVNDHKVRLTSEAHPQNIDWKKEAVDIVVESTGKFKTREQLSYHLKNGAKKVILCVPPDEDDIKMLVFGINEQTLAKDDNIISNASCTTNNAAPMIKVIQELC